MKFCPPFLHFLTIWIKAASGGGLSCTLKDRDFHRNRQNESHTLRTSVSSPYPRAAEPGHYSSLPAPNLQHTANQERNDQCGNQHHSRELLMMGIVMLETC